MPRHVAEVSPYLSIAKLQPASGPVLRWKFTGQVPSRLNPEGPAETAEIQFPVWSDPGDPNALPENRGMYLWGPAGSDPVHLHVGVKADVPESYDIVECHVDAYPDHGEIEMYTPWGNAALRAEQGDAYVNGNWGSRSFEIRADVTGISLILSHTGGDPAHATAELHAPSDSKEAYVVLSTANGSKYKLTITDAGVLNTAPYP